MLNHYISLSRDRSREVDRNGDTSIISSMVLFCYGVVWYAGSIFILMMILKQITWHFVLEDYPSLRGDDHLHQYWRTDEPMAASSSRASVFIFWRISISSTMKTTMYYSWAAAICEFWFSHSLSLSPLLASFDYRGRMRTEVTRSLLSWLVKHSKTQYINTKYDLNRGRWITLRGEIITYQSSQAWIIRAANSSGK